jgi:hypothetical protein
LQRVSLGFNPGMALAVHISCRRGAVFHNLERPGDQVTSLYAIPDPL